jgi:hypothetical protein
MPQRCGNGEQTAYASLTDHKVPEISLPDLSRLEIAITETEIRGFVALLEEFVAARPLPVDRRLKVSVHLGVKVPAGSA